MLALSLPLRPRALARIRSAIVLRVASVRYAVVGALPLVSAPVMLAATGVTARGNVFGDTTCACAIDHAQPTAKPENTIAAASVARRSARGVIPGRFHHESPRGDGTVMASWTKCCQ